MGCLSGRAEKGVIHEQQKWHYITLNDFRGSSCGTVFSYIWLWILVLVTCGVYVADTFTAVKLLAFNQWSSAVQPAIPFEVAKWIFSGCIMLSWTLAIVSWVIAIRTINRGCVTDDYLDSTAVTIQSIRPGGGWKRFLVFASLTKSKKKVSWIAIFVYFQRQGCLHLLAAEGPRQVVNALTIYSVAKADLFDNGTGSGFSKFFNNLKALGQEHKTEVIILSTMCYTLVVWVISMLLLLLALILYVVFLWHHIHDETLAGFCRRKVETRLARIVKAKSDKELARQQKNWERAERKAGRTGRPVSPTVSLANNAFTRKPTLPMLGDETMQSNDFKEHDLFRANSIMSTSTVPPYSSQESFSPTGQSSLHRQPTLPDMTGRPGAPSRSATGYSVASYSSDAPLLAQSGEMGYSDPNRSYPMDRSMTNISQRSFSQPISPGGRPSLPPLSTQQGGPRYPLPSRTNTGFSSQGRVSPMSAATTPYSAQSNRPLLSGQSPMTPWDARTQSPASRGMAYEMTPVEGRQHGGGDDYFAMASGQPRRVPTAPPNMQMQNFSRGPTASSAQNFAQPAATASPVHNFSRPPPSASVPPSMQNFSRAPTMPQVGMTSNPSPLYESASPQEINPSSRALPSSLQIARRDVSAPAGSMPPQKPPPSGALPWPPTQRSVTAPVPEHVGGQQVPYPYSGPAQRSGSAAPNGAW